MVRLGGVWWSDCKKLQGMQMVCKMKLHSLLFKCAGQVMHSDTMIFHVSMIFHVLHVPYSAFGFWTFAPLLRRKLQLEGRTCCGLPNRFSNMTSSTDRWGMSQNVREGLQQSTGQCSISVPSASCQPVEAAPKQCYKTWHMTKPDKAWQNLRLLWCLPCDNRREVWAEGHRRDHGPGTEPFSSKSDAQMSAIPCKFSWILQTVLCKLQKCIAPICWLSQLVFSAGIKATVDVELPQTATHDFDIVLVMLCGRNSQVVCSTYDIWLLKPSTSFPFPAPF